MEAKAKSSLRISNRTTTFLGKKMKGFKVPRAKKFLEDLAGRKIDINGKHYTKTAEELLNLINSAEKNAVFAGLNPDKMFVNINTGTGFSFYRPKSRFRFRRRQAKVTNVIITLKEMNA